MRKVLAQSRAFVLIAALILMMNFGGFLSAGMMMSDATMHDCPFMGVPTLCGMSPLEHAAQWQAMTAATTQQFQSIALLLLLVIVWSYVSARDILQPTPLYLLQRRDRGRVFDPLRLAFARGILNTKRF